MLNGLRVLMVTSVNMSANPRCLKEVRTLSQFGADVTVLKFDFNNWSLENEKEVETALPKVKWIKLRVGKENLFPWVLSTIANKAARFFRKVLPNNVKFLAYELDKRSFLIERELESVKPDFDVIIGHNPGVLYPVCQYAQKHNIPFGFDVEDYHPGEDGKEINSAMLALMQATLANASYITAASPLIINKVRRDIKYMGSSDVVNNVFERRLQPIFKNNNIGKDGQLKIVWFSQFVGLNRGLQDLVNALNLIDGFKVQFAIIGNYTDEVKHSLQSLLTNKLHDIVFVAPLKEKELIEKLSEYHIGLASEPAFSLNNDIALSNKVLSYILAGNAVLASNTQAQKLFLETYPQAGVLYEKGNSQQLAQILQSLYNKQEVLQSMRKATYELAATSLCWDIEQHIFLRQVLSSTGKAA